MMSENDSDKLYKKFKIKNIILAIIAALCVVALIVPIGIPVNADVDGIKKIENRLEATANNENIDKEHVKELFISGKWVAELPNDELDDPNRGPSHEAVVDSSIELNIYNNGAIYIQEVATVEHVDPTSNEKIKVEYVRASDVNTQGDTLLVRSIKEKMADVKPN